MTKNSETRARRIFATFCIVVMTLATILGLGLYLYNYRVEEVDKAITAANERTTQYTEGLTALEAHKAELAKLEQTLNGRQTALTEAEGELATKQAALTAIQDELAQARTALAAEQTAFAAKQARILELAQALIDAINDDQGSQNSPDNPDETATHYPVIYTTMPTE